MNQENHGCSVGIFRYVRVVTVMWTSGRGDEVSVREAGLLNHGGAEDAEQAGCFYHEGTKVTKQF